MRVEYLIIIDSKDPFCRDKKSFDSYLQSNADIQIKGAKISHKRLEVDYELQNGETEVDENRFFHIKVTCQDSGRLEEFEDLLKAIRKLLHKASLKKPQVLWDDVSGFYSEKAYPKIHEIENLMRKLITKFMLTNVGLGWTKETIPEGLKKSTRTRPTDNNNYLYETDFKDLSTFLFDEYRTQDIHELQKQIEALEKKGGDVSLADLKGFLPKSNWERYFREHVECESEQLKTQWGRLYSLRCKIAHNNFFAKEEYQQVLSLTKSIKPVIENAIKNLDKVEVPEEEREELAEVVASKTSAMHGEYIQKWKSIESTLIELAHMDVQEAYLHKRPIGYIMNTLKERKVLPWRVYQELKQAHDIRNVIVHSPDRRPNNDELFHHLQILDALLEEVQDIEFDFEPVWDIAE